MTRDEIIARIMQCTAECNQIEHARTRTFEFMQIAMRRNDGPSCEQSRAMLHTHLDQMLDMMGTALTLQKMLAESPA